MKRRIRTYAEVAEPAGANLAEQVHAQHARLHARLAGVRSIVAVASGKGGVGKSFVAAQLAATLAARGQRVGALDADLNGPSLAAMLAASRAPLRVDQDGVHPALGRDGCRVMSSDLLLAEPDSPLRWRGTDAGAFVRQSALETGMLREFLSDVVWGDLDVLIVDLPPGTDKIARTLEL
ncbi:MAG: P-loop NTPase, partial [Longimicrobiales bacterium]